MSKIAVVYWSGTGNTEAMANFVAEGATGAGAEAEVISCADFSADKVAEYDAFAFGCPAMGSEELEYDEFQPMWDEVKETLGDKKVVLFGSYSWAEGEWMDNWKADADDTPFTNAVYRMYSVIYDHLVNGKPLAVTPRQVRQQIAVIQKCHEMNPLPRME